jgi:Spy/CpxP family protein refolding chaperone
VSNLPFLAVVSKTNFSGGILMRKHVFFVLCGLLVGLAGSPTLSAAHMGMGHGGGWGRGGGGLSLLSPWILQKLNLTPQQQAQVQTIQTTHQNTQQQLMTQLKTMHDDASQVFYAPGDPNTDKLNDSLKSVNQVQSQIMDDRLAEALEVRALLTPDQLATAAQLLEKIRAMRAQMHDLSAQP